MKNNIIILDTETGGLDEKENPIMEIAMIVKDITTWEEIGRWESLVKGYSDLSYDQKALDVHGITVSECNNSGLSLEDAVKTCIQLFKKFTPKGDRGGGRPILAGHNLPFDIKMLKMAFKLAGYNLSDYVLSNGDEITILDSLPMAKFFWPNESNHKLGDCCKKAGLGDFTAHRAMPDVIASADLFEFFRDKYNSNKSSNSQSDETSTKKQQRSTVKSEHKLPFKF